MREDLALSHLLLNQARTLTRQIAKLKDLQLEQALKELIDNINITYQRQEQNYIISSTVLDKKVSLTTDKKTFQFYKRADLNKSETSLYQIGKDPIAEDNHNKANQILLDLLAQTNIKIPSDSIKSVSASTSNTGTKIDYLAWISVSLIALLSALITWSQATNTFNAIDNSYTLEIAWRIINGEVPYRDFNLVVAPGVYVKQAILMKLFGYQAVVGVWWCMFAMAAIVILTFIILKLIDTPRWLAVNLCLLAAVGGNVVIPYVWYDVDALLCCLASMALLLWSEKRTQTTKGLYWIGLLTALPIIFKQNLGTAHIIMISGIIYLQWIAFSYRFSWRRLILYHLGLISGLAILILPFWYLAALHDLYYYNITLPFELRVGDKSIITVLCYFIPGAPGNLLSTYSDNAREVIILPFFSGVILIWGTMALAIIHWFVGIHKSIVQLLLLLWIFGMAMAGVYAQKLLSIFPQLPLLAIMIAMFWQFIKHFNSISKLVYFSINLIVPIVALAMLFHAQAGYQLGFYTDPFTEPTPFNIAHMDHMRASREYVLGLRELIEYVNQIPANETITQLITEDPLHFLTGRKSPMRTLQRFTQSGGDPKKIYLPELERVQPNWIVVKTAPQFFYWQQISPVEEDWLYANYRPVAKLKQYQIWKRLN